MKPLTLKECLIVADTHDCFKQKIEEVEGRKLIQFNYRLASYTDFCAPFALDMRGITFDYDSEELLALPFQKFFNYGENPFTDPKIIDPLQIYQVSEKMDGSLVYFYMLNGKIHCKTKFNCYAPQAGRAMEIITRSKEYSDFVIDQLANHNTPMFEYVGPDNQHVVPYHEPRLTYLGSRNMITGQFTPLQYISPNIHLPKIIENTTINQLIQHCESSTNLEEGVVVIFTNGLMIKLKTRKYKDTQMVINSVSNKVNLSNLVLNEQLDDVMTVLPPELHSQVYEFQDKLIKDYKEVLLDASDYYNDNITKDRKEYALGAMGWFQKTFKFHVAMALYNGVVKLDNLYTDTKLIDSYIKTKPWEKF